MAPIELTGLPETAFLASPAPVQAVEGGFELSADGNTDWVSDPISNTRVQSAPALLFPTDGDFILSAAVKPTFDGTFDAGVLVAYQNDDTWAKLCFEVSPQGQPMVVSVVTRGFSDDCNSVPIDEDTVYLRLSRVGAGFLLHYSADGEPGTWQFVRSFTLGPATTATKAGFIAQSPFGSGMTARFTHVSYRNETLSDFRSGE
jgi:regulation of enolase protein 1 (concanavalin A-like superfamily)